MVVLTDEMEDDFTVDEMIGVIKWLKLSDGMFCQRYLEQLEEWREEGYGEVSITSCKDTLQ